MYSSAQTVKQYLDELPFERQADMHALRDLIFKNLPQGFEEAMNWGMITYQVPLAVFPDTYNGQPLMYAALASQKNHMALYLTSIYADPARKQAFEDAYKLSGNRLNAGKSCVRFRHLSELPLDLIAQTISSMSMDEFIQLAKSARKNKQ